MTTATSSFTWSNSSYTTIDTVIGGINSLFTAAGLVQTSDTGQSPNSGNSSSTITGGQVFKFPDNSTFTTRPIFIRVDYTSSLAITMTVGSSTNGAGAIGTPNIITSASSFSISAFQNPLNSYACYSNGTFTCVLGAFPSSTSTQSNNCAASLVVDRARDATGAALSSGYLVEWGQGNTVNSNSRSMFGSSSPATSANFIPSLIPSAVATTSAAGSNVNVFRHYMMVPGVAPSLGSITYYESEFGALTPFTCTVLGSSHTYMPMGRAMNQWSAYAVNISSGATHCGAVLWE